MPAVTSLHIASPWHGTDAPRVTRWLQAQGKARGPKCVGRKLEGVARAGEITCLYLLLEHAPPCSSPIERAEGEEIGEEKMAAVAPGMLLPLLLCRFTAHASAPCPPDLCRYVAMPCRGLPASTFIRLGVWKGVGRHASPYRLNNHAQMLRTYNHIPRY